MTNLITMLPFSVSNPALPVIPEADIIRLNPWESDSYAHWLFGGDSGSLTDGVNGRALTVPGSAPSYSSKHLTVAQNFGNGLRSGLMETATQRVTMACVVRDPGTITGIAIPFGTLDASHGIAPFRNSAGSNIFLTARTVNNMNSGVTGLAMTANSWLFIAMALDFSAATKDCTILRGGSAAVTLSGTGTLVPQTAGGFALGASYYASSAVQNLDFAEAVLFDRTLSPAELGNLYIRSKNRMAARGLTVV